MTSDYSPTSPEMDYMDEQCKKNVVHETMTKVVVAGYTIRVWRNCGQQFRMGPDREITAKLFAWDGIGGPKEIVRLLADLMDVEAFEILDEKGNGGLYYPNWS